MLEPRIAVNHCLDGSTRLVIVRPWINADPKLGGIDIDDLISEHGAADVSPDVADPRNGLQLMTDPTDDTAHLRLRCAGRAIQVNHQVALPER